MTGGHQNHVIPFIEEVHGFSFYSTISRSFPRAMTMTMPMTSSKSDLETFDLWDIWPEWWRAMTNKEIGFSGKKWIFESEKKESDFRKISDTETL